MVKETYIRGRGGNDTLRFQSPLGEVVKETKVQCPSNFNGGFKKFQSPLGEVVKETNAERVVSSNGKRFQSPLGEVVKETMSLA